MSMKNKIIMSKWELEQHDKELIARTGCRNVELLLSAFGLALHRRYGFGHKRTLDVFEEVNSIMEGINTGEKTTEDLLDELEKECGVRINLGGASVDSR